MTQQEYNRLCSTAANRAQSRLRDKYADEYKEMVNEERIKLGLLPSRRKMYSGTPVRHDRRPPKSANRYFVFARNRQAADRWCAKNGLDPLDRNVHYVHDHVQLRKFKIDVGKDSIVFIAGWRMEKSLKRQEHIEQSLHVAAMMTWQEILNHPRTIFAEAN